MKIKYFILAFIMTHFTFFSYANQIEKKRPPVPFDANIWNSTNKTIYCESVEFNLLKKRSLRKIITTKDKSCLVISGKWFLPFSGKTTQKIDDIVINRIIDTKNAHYHGGFKWSKEKRDTFLKDIENFELFSKGSQIKKINSPYELWLPTNKAAVCPYLQKVIYIKQKYSLSISKVENTLFIHNKC